MLLRSKILILFVTLALAPLLAVGINDYVQSLRLVTRLVEAHLSLSGERAARAIGTRYLQLDADLRELAALVESPGGAQPAALRAQPDTGDARWLALTEPFDLIEIRSASGALLATLKSAPAPDACGQPIEFSTPLGSLPASVPGYAPAPAPDHDRDSAPRPPPPTRLHARAPAARVLAQGALIPAFGRTGDMLLVDRVTGEPVYDPRCVRAGGVIASSSFEGPDGERIEAASLAGWAGVFRYREAGVERTASFVNLAEPAWTVVASTDMAEFTSTEGRARAASLLFVVFLALVASGGFAILITQIMRSLEEVTTAAGRIGQGDFSPWLPPPGNDEVGRLSLAIGAMVSRIKEMMKQLERSRQMAVVGELASHLAHEIRNPLSSIRLNLQSVGREVRRGQVPADLPVVLDLCLREITRLDRVVNDVLRLGRTAPARMRPCRLHALVEESLDIVRPQLAQRGIGVEARLEAAADTLAADGELLSGALLNLYLNAADAMPDGGTLEVWTELARGEDDELLIRVHVVDDGRGVEPELREQIFRPFFTTRAHGSGIGLPVALQTAELHGGRLYLEKRSELERGAEFVIELPVEAAASAASTGRATARAGARARSTEFALAADPKTSPTPSRSPATAVSQSTRR